MWVQRRAAASITRSQSPRTTVFSAKVNGLPTDGSTVYVTMYSQIGGQWVNNQSTYTSGP
jgi:hypothetical protein